MSDLLKKLESAFQKIDSLSDNEKEVSINDQKITLGIISGVVEDSIQTYLMESIDLKTIVAEKGVKIPAFMRAMKIETVAYAIKAINGDRIDRVNFFSVPNPDGSKVDLKIERQLFLRKKLREWPPFIVNYLFNQYILLVNDTTKVMEPKFEIEDLDDLVRNEVKEDSEALQNLTETSKELSESKDLKDESSTKKDPIFRKVETEGGVLDQAGY